MSTDDAPFPFTKPAAPTKKDKLGDKGRARMVMSYIEHDGRPLPSCAMRLLERLVDGCGYEHGALFYGEKRLLHDCRFTHRSLIKGRAVLKAANIVHWTSVEDCPYREVIWSDPRVNCYQINWPKLNALFSELAAHREAFTRLVRDAACNPLNNNDAGLANADFADQVPTGSWCERDQVPSGSWSKRDQVPNGSCDQGPDRVL